MKTWTKYTFVCDPEECDTLIEVTCDNYGFPSGVMKLTCPCGRKLDVLSVADATIPSTTTTKEETMSIIDETPIMVKALQDHVAMLEGKVTDYQNQITNLTYVKENLNKSVNDYYTKTQELRSYLMDNHEELELHTEEIANIFDIPLTKTVEFEATVIVTGSVEVELFGGIDLDEFLSENLYVDSAHGDVYISDHSVDNVVEQ
jgi:predicted nuclease with TOPRIM domain